MNEKKGGLPLIIGHRGAYDVAPENTLKGFKKAIELKADYIEFDVHQTKDGALVIIHDIDILRRMGIKSTIEQMTLKELKKLDFGEGERIPELWELVEVAKGKVKFLCELKAQGISKKVINLLREEHLIDSTIIESYIIEELMEVRKIEPSIELAALVPKNRGILLEWEKRKTMIQGVIDLGITNIVTRLLNVDDLFVRYCHKNNIKVFVYSLNTELTMKRFISMGVDGIIVNSISKAKALLTKPIQKKNLNNDLEQLP